MKNRFKKITLALVFFMPLFLNAQSKWGKAVWDAYMNSCVESASASMEEGIAREYCACTGIKLEARYPDATKLSSLGNEEITELATQCIEEVDNKKSGSTNSNSKADGPKPPTPPGKTATVKKEFYGATNWSQTGYDSFMNTCVDSAKESLGEAPAKKYCDCSASKLQIMYPDENKVTVTEAEINKVAEECLGQ